MSANYELISVRTTQTASTRMDLMFASANLASNLFRISVQVFFKAKN